MSKLKEEMIEAEFRAYFYGLGLTPINLGLASHHFNHSVHPGFHGRLVNLSCNDHQLVLTTSW